MKKDTFKIIIDIIQTVTLIALCLFGELSGLSHELLGIAFCISFIAHLVINRHSLFRFSTGNTKRTSLCILNIATSISIILCIASGFMISELFPWMNIGSSLMHDVHYYSFIATALLTGIHLISHFPWIHKSFSNICNKKRVVIISALLSAFLIVAGTIWAGYSFNETREKSNEESSISVDDSNDSKSENAEETTERNEDIEDTQNIITTETSVESSDTDTTEATDSTVFTADTLSKYNGKNGMPAYIAVNGIVYDVSDIFRNGEHHGYSAGIDLTDAFNREHSSRELQGLTIVGTYDD